MSTKIPIGHKMVMKIPNGYTKIYQRFPFKGLPKYAQIGILYVRNYINHLAT
jgi:hypothetical protein